ncbi:PREDICTED: uncharacterized protein LOC109187442 [Ipomoea nil]|uniref:uncharacterized protein LOC109187442 n=1 Tax=Ipomoea nil TaxID=35883 RepID=UPI000901B0D6|nr:PREDICTED: uncharacterized protein LOC109187442 [Ipomoea nil]
MNTLDSPVEALAFNYLRFDKLWTWWVSVLAAAAGFWRIKVPSLSPPSKPSSEPCQAAAARRPASSEPPSTAPRTTVTPFSASEGVDGSTKGKFAAYFDCDDELAGGNDAESNGNGGGGGEVLVKDWYGCWERVMETRMGEMGWYRYQDITVIDGNVVRLWEGGGRRRSTAAVVGVACVVTTWQSSIGRHY